MTTLARRQPKLSMLAEPAQQRYVVAYIASAGHSGSTLLDLTMGSHSKASSVGEIAMLRGYAKMQRKVSHRTQLGNSCTCGAPSIFQCNFWSGVDKRLLASEKPGLSQLDIQSDDPITFANHNRMLFDAIAAETGASVIVDSSKTSSRLRKLTATRPFPLVGIHLVRNPKGQIHSLRKIEQKPIFYYSALYSLSHHIRSRLLRAIPHHLVRYESLASDPERELSRIMQFLGLQYEPDQLSWSPAQRHNIGGNAMRARSSNAIRIDDSWKLGLRRHDQAMIDLLTASVRLQLWARSVGNGGAIRDSSREPNLGPTGGGNKD